MSKFKTQSKKYFISSKKITVIPSGVTLEQLDLQRTNKPSKKTSKFFKKHPKLIKFFQGTKEFGVEIGKDIKIAGKKFKEGAEAVKGGYGIVRSEARDVRKFYKEGAKQREKERKERIAIDKKMDKELFMKW
jgi:hypothetical protein